MENLNISIYSITGNSFCVEAEDGEKVYELLAKALRAGKQITLSFAHVELLTTAFLNSAIGKLYKDFSQEQIRAQLKVENLSQSGAISLKRVVETAKAFYSDNGDLRKSIQDILGE